MALSDIYQKASLVQIPSGYKAADDKLYSVVPNSGDGDFTIDSDADATRVNKDGLIETTVADQARLNYDPSNPQDPHLLLEPERRNQFTNSENLANIDFRNNSTVTTDNIIAPNGSLTADKTTQTSGGYLRETVSVSNGTTYSFSVFLKKGDLRYAVVRSLFSQNGTTPANSNNVFDLDNGSVIYTGTDVISASIEAYSNDWYRCSFVSLASGTSSASFIDFYFSSSSSSTQSSGTAGFGYGWGMQLEAGSYPTSYIPTTIAVTRTADFVSGGGDANLFNDSEGTLFVEAKVPDNNTSIISAINISDGTLANRVLFQWGGALNRLRTYVVVSYSNQTLIETNSYNTENYLKIAVRYKTNDVAFYVNGTKIDFDDNANTFPNGTLDTIDFTNGNLGSDYYFNGSLKQLMYFDTALTDAELIALTS